MEFLKNVIRGAVIGGAEVIPGVSGGTLAVLLNIYDRLIHALSHLKRDFAKNFWFLLAILLGMGAGILGFSYIIKYLLEHFPMQVNFFFLGLIIGIVPMLYRKARTGTFRPLQLAPFFTALAVMVILAVASITSGKTVEIITTMQTGVFIRFLLVGFLAAICLILPGISGSMIMVIFGIYDSVITAVSELNLIILLPVGIGVLLGILFGARLIDFCLHRFPQATYFAILGLVLGSTIALFYRSGFNLYSLNGSVSILTLLLGSTISWLFTSDYFLKDHKPAAAGSK